MFQLLTMALGCGMPCTPIQEDDVLRTGSWWVDGWHVSYNALIMLELVGSGVHLGELFRYFRWYLNVKGTN